MVCSVTTDISVGISTDPFDLQWAPLACDDHLCPLSVQHRTIQQSSVIYIINCIFVNQVLSRDVRRRMEGTVREAEQVLGI
jgi:hypothetical protein